MTRAAFQTGTGAIVSASRSILYAHAAKQYAHAADWKEAVRQATLDMKTDLARVLSP